jgi:hypothetical protein
MRRVGARKMEKKSRNSFPNIIFYAFQALLQCSRGNQEKKKKKEKGLGDDDDDKLGCFQKDLSQVPKLELNHTCNLKSQRLHL